MRGGVGDAGVVASSTNLQLLQFICAIEVELEWNKVRSGRKRLCKLQLAVLTLTLAGRAVIKSLRPLRAVEATEDRRGGTVALWGQFVDAVAFDTRFLISKLYFDPSRAVNCLRSISTAIAISKREMKLLLYGYICKNNWYAAAVAQWHKCVSVSATIVDPTRGLKYLIFSFLCSG